VASVGVSVDGTSCHSAQGTERTTEFGQSLMPKIPLAGFGLKAFPFVNSHMVLKENAAIGIISAVEFMKQFWPKYLQVSNVIFKIFYFMTFWCHQSQILCPLLLKLLFMSYFGINFNL
jgi:hypothetical protein